jgi:hypothetical protein
MRKLLVMAIGVVLALTLTTTSAFAFECYNASRSDRGNAAAGAHSAALMTTEEILTNPEIVGLCPEGAAFVISEMTALGFRTDILVNFNALMAGGLEGTEHGEELLHDGRGIDHLSDEFFAAADPLIGQAFATICV